MEQDFEPKEEALPCKPGCPNLTRVLRREQWEPEWGRDFSGQSQDRAGSCPSSPGSSGANLGGWQPFLQLWAHLSLSTCRGLLFTFNEIISGESYSGSGTVLSSVSSRLNSEAGCRQPQGQLGSCSGAKQLFSIQAGARQKPQSSPRGEKTTGNFIQTEKEANVS